MRLRRGDLSRPTVYGDDPIAVARRFVEAGARWLHIVDLDGASGAPSQADVVRSIVAAVDRQVACQVAGGLRDRAAVAGMLEAGASRVVVGTAALRDSAFARCLVADHGATRVVAAIDVRDGRALGDGWRPGAASVPASAALERLAEAGVERFAVTAIDRDGIMAGPDLDLLRAAVGLGVGAVIASGGVRTVEDLLAVRTLGAAGAIVGRALYEGGIDLGVAVATMAAEDGRDDDASGPGSGHREVGPAGS